MNEIAHGTLKIAEQRMNLGVGWRTGSMTGSASIDWPIPFQQTSNRRRPPVRSLSVSTNWPLANQTLLILWFTLLVF